LSTGAGGRLVAEPTEQAEVYIRLGRVGRIRRCSGEDLLLFARKQVFDPQVEFCAVIWRVSVFDKRQIFSRR